MLAAFASLSVLAATASSACDVTELAKCARTHQKPYLAPDFPLRASADQSGDYCEWASKLYGCIKDAGCMEPHLEKECARAFELAGCDGADVCKQGHRALADIEKRKPEPAPANAPASAPAPVEPEPTPAPAADADAAAADAEGEATDAEPDAFDYEKYPPHAPFFGFMGAAGALVFANLGAAYGTAKSGRGISTMGVLYPNLVMKHIIPVVMAGVLGIYGLIIAVIIGNGVTGFKNNEPVYTGECTRHADRGARLPGLAARTRRPRAALCPLRGWCATRASARGRSPR